MEPENGRSMMQRAGIKSPRGELEMSVSAMHWHQYMGQGVQWSWFYPNPDHLSTKTNVYAFNRAIVLGALAKVGGNMVEPQFSTQAEAHLSEAIALIERSRSIVSGVAMEPIETLFWNKPRRDQSKTEQLQEQAEYEAVMDGVTVADRESRDNELLWRNQSGEECFMLYRTSREVLDPVAYVDWLWMLGRVTIDLIKPLQLCRSHLIAGGPVPSTMVPGLAGPVTRLWDLLEQARQLEYAQALNKTPETLISDAGVDALQVLDTFELCLEHLSCALLAIVGDPYTGRLRTALKPYLPMTGVAAYLASIPEDFVNSLDLLNSIKSPNTCVPEPHMQRFSGLLWLLRLKQSLDGVLAVLARHRPYVLGWSPTPLQEFESTIDYLKLWKRLIDLIPQFYGDSVDWEVLPTMITLFAAGRRASFLATPVYRRIHYDALPHRTYGVSMTGIMNYGPAYVDEASQKLTDWYTTAPWAKTTLKQTLVDPQPSQQHYDGVIKLLSTRVGYSLRPLRGNFFGRQCVVLPLTHAAMDGMPEAQEIKAAQAITLAKDQPYALTTKGTVLVKPNAHRKSAPDIAADTVNIQLVKPVNVSSLRWRIEA